MTNFCRLVGYFLAEGSYKNGLIFSFYKNEEDLIADVIHISTNLFNLSPLIIKMKSNAVNIQIDSKILKSFLRKFLRFRKELKIRGFLGLCIMQMTHV